MIKEQYRDTFGHLTHGIGKFETYAVFVQERDSLGRVLRSMRFDKDGEPALSEDGYHQWEATYDPIRGLLAESKYFGLDGEPVRFKSAYHHVVREFNSRGFEVKSTYFDENKESATHPEGHHIWTAKYNELGLRY